MIIEPIEFKDEILDVTSQPDNKPRYRIRDNNGNVLYENVQLEVQTPVVQEGTKVNADMFNLINGAMQTVASKENGDDFKKYIETGEYGGLKTPDLLDPLYEVKDMWQKEIESNISTLRTEVSSLKTRVTALEG